MSTQTLNSESLPIPYGKQEITNNDVQAVIDVLRSDFLTQGPLVEKFENEFSKYIGSKYAIAVNSGTAALHLSCFALGVKSGSKILTTPITFAATANSVLYCGGTVEFVDICHDDFCIDPIALEKKILSSQDKFEGIIMVDFAGHPGKINKIKEIAQKYNLWILEDACHATGGGFQDQNNKIQKCGNGFFSECAIFSFHPVKHIAAGEGGMITTNNHTIYEKVKMLRTHGIVRDEKLLKENHGGWYHEMQDLGFNYRMPDINCALGLSQLLRAEININKRRDIASFYRKHLNNPYIKLPENYNGHAYHLFIIRTQFRKQLYDYLRSFKIYTQVHYLPVYKHPYWQSLRQWPTCPNAEKYYSECLSIPMFPSLTKIQLEYIVEKLNAFSP
jgi:UDP-4-amino-4,6-dideoxy-N-acetyl-beta-L-altrosamine transaminase